jgi:hypothetical protein
VIEGQIGRLFHRLLDDAAMFAPCDAAPKAAVRNHARVRASATGGMVGSLASLHSRLRSVDEFAGTAGLDRVEVSMVVPEGIDGLAAAAKCADRCSPRVQVTSVETPLHPWRIDRALAALTRLRRGARQLYLEIRAGELTEGQVHLLAREGLGVKLRTGSTSIDGFLDEASLARAVVLCAAERLAFRCTSGLRPAIRQRDSATLSEQHGFLNIALAARVAAGTGSVRATQAVLAQRDRREIARRITELRDVDVVAIWALLASCTTPSVERSASDLMALGLAVDR